jgi:hypothetical protein
MKKLPSYFYIRIRYLFWFNWIQLEVTQLGCYLTIETKFVKMDVMSSICVHPHIDIHLDVLVSSIKTNIDHFFTIKFFWLD